MQYPDNIDPAEGHPELRFEVYLAHHAEQTNDPEGDFVGDSKCVIECGNFAKGNSWGNIDFFLLMRHACSGAHRAGHILYHNRYLPWVMEQLANDESASGNTEDT